MALITTEEFKSLRDIGNKIDTDKAAEAILQAETYELYDVLGDFYFDVESNKAVAEWLPLLNGGSFTVNGETFIHAGLKSLVADFAYSRYLIKVNINITPFGAVTKQDDNSTPVDKSTLADQAAQSRRDADMKFKQIERYLSTNKTLFSRYFSGSNPISGSTGGRMTII